MKAEVKGAYRARWRYKMKITIENVYRAEMMKALKMSVSSEELIEKMAAPLKALNEIVNERREEVEAVEYKREADEQAAEEEAEAAELKREEIEYLVDEYYDEDGEYPADELDGYEVIELDEYEAEYEEEGADDEEDHHPEVEVEVEVEELNESDKYLVDLSSYEVEVEVEVEALNESDKYLVDLSVEVEAVEVEAVEVEAVEAVEYPADMSALLKQFNDNYKIIYEFDGVEGEEALLDCYEALSDELIELRSAFNEYRGDILSSDTEVLAFMFALIQFGHHAAVQ